MIYTSPLVAQALAVLIILISCGCIIYGALHLYKPRAEHKKSIYVSHAVPPKKLSIIQRLKASWMYGWDAGRVYAEKKRQGKLSDK